MHVTHDASAATGGGIPGREVRGAAGDSVDCC